jgi:hypothetical protein
LPPTSLSSQLHATQIGTRALQPTKIERFSSSHARKLNRLRSGCVASSRLRASAARLLEIAIRLGELEGAAIAQRAFRLPGSVHSRRRSVSLAVARARSAHREIRSDQHATTEWPPQRQQALGSVASAPAACQTSDRPRVDRLAFEKRVNSSASSPAIKRRRAQFRQRRQIVSDARQRAQLPWRHRFRQADLPTMSH